MASPLAKQFSRREFTSASLSALFVGMAVTVIGCGDTQKGSNALVTAPSPVTGQGDAGFGPADGTSGVISTNHGHIAFVTAVQLIGDEDVVLSIRGTANHDHSVYLSGHQIDQISSGERISVDSSVSRGAGSSGISHLHTVVFN